jgi:hypothetical protein
LTTGHDELPRELLPLPVNCRHEAYLPGLAMADHADLLIHHGGYGSCQTGLFAGKPAVIMPTFSERESNARRVAALGAAYDDSLKGRDAGVLDGLTGDHRFFLSFAQVWRSKERDDALRNQVMSDVQRPAIFRVNGQLPNLDAWVPPSASSPTTNSTSRPTNA